MERLNKSAPPTKLTDAQKKALAELDSKYAAKIAEREIALTGQIATADPETAQALRDQLALEHRKLQSDLEDKKEQVRKNK